MLVVVVVVVVSRDRLQGSTADWLLDDLPITLCALCSLARTEKSGARLSTGLRRLSQFYFVEETGSSSQEGFGRLVQLMLRSNCVCSFSISI